MPSSAAAGPSRAQRAFAWPAGKQTWIEILVGLALATVVLAAVWFDNTLTTWQRIVIWNLLLAAIAVLSRKGWLKFFGPVLFYDLVRISRRSRTVLLRCVYAGVLLLVFYLQYAESFANSRIAPGTWRMTSTGWVPAGPVRAFTANTRFMADFAEHFFNTFLIVQFSLVMMLTPVYAAGSIAEEKDRKTLEYLLATDLSNREIVLSKLVSRLANLTLTVMTGLPILGFVQFLGGVDPDLVLAGFAATGLTMASLTALSTLNSVYARRPRDAILLTYLCLAGYVGIGILLEGVKSVAALATLPLTRGATPLTLEDLIDGFNSGNLPVALYNLKLAYAGGKNLTGMISGMLRGYLIFHALIVVFCATWAVLRLRAVALQQRSNKPTPSNFRHRPRIRPRLAIKPMVWKEVFVEPGFRLTRMGWFVVSILVLISLLPALWIGARYVGLIGPPYPVRVGYALSEVVRDLNYWVRITASILGCLMLLGVAARASTSITSERDRETLDALLTSPLQSHDILFGKWLGSLLSVRWAWLWLGLIWVIGIAAGALHPLSVGLFCIAWLVYGSCFAGLGLWFSTACRTSLRAMLWTLSTTIMVGAGHLGLWMCCLPIVALQGFGQEFIGLQAMFSPPIVFFWVFAVELGESDAGDVRVIFAFFALFLWALAALFLWTITRSRFRRISARMPHRRPELADSVGRPDAPNPVNWNP